MSIRNQRKTRRPVISERTQCSVCIRHNFCSHEKEARNVCVVKSSNGGYAFTRDAYAARKLSERRKAEIEAFCASFKRVKGDQIGFTRTGHAFFIPADRATRMLLSHNGEKQRVGDDLWGKWCENCGAPFETVNEGRRLCGACHDEICERLNWSAAHCDELPGETM